jgi:hypothetical protein
MDCLNTFRLAVSNVFTYNNAGTDVKTWGVGNTEYWTVYDSTNITIKEIQGFKNINIFKVEMIGTVRNETSGTNQAIVDDFSFGITLNGQTSVIGGALSTNSYSMSETSNFFLLNKYNPKLLITDGIKSVTSIRIQDFIASGYGPVTANVVTLALQVQFIFYYQFQEEGFALL